MNSRILARTAARSVLSVARRLIARCMQARRETRMRRWALAPIACLVALGFLLLESGSYEKPQTREQRVSERLAAVRIPFVANSGQTDPAVAYHASTFAGTVFVTRDGQIVYSLPEARVLASGEQTTARK